jgi:hypothetical protein
MLTPNRVIQQHMLQIRWELKEIWATRVVKSMVRWERQAHWIAKTRERMMQSVVLCQQRTNFDHGRNVTRRLLGDLNRDVARSVSVDGDVLIASERKMCD